MDVLSFVAVLTAYIWVVLPLTNGSAFWNGLFTVAAPGLAAFFLWRKGHSWRQVGIRLDNFPRALLAYLGLALPYAGAVLYWFRDSIHRDSPIWQGPGRAVWQVTWALLQEFCLLSFLLTRLRQVLGRDDRAVLAAAGIFAFFHLPNPFLTLYTLGGGWIAAWLFLRWPNLPAAALAHVAASTLIGKLLSPEVTGWMRVGPPYWGSK